jgi:hypothetical protein
MPDDSTGPASLTPSKNRLVPWLIVGAALGASVGAIFGELALGLGLGLAAGILIGALLARKNEKNKP